MWDGTQDLGNFLRAHGVPENAISYIKNEYELTKICELKNMTESNISLLQYKNLITCKTKLYLRFLIYWVTRETESNDDHWTWEKENLRNEAHEDWNRRTRMQIHNKTFMQIPNVALEDRFTMNSSFMNPYMTNL